MSTQIHSSGVPGGKRKHILRYSVDRDEPFYMSMRLSQHGANELTLVLTSDPVWTALLVFSALVGSNGRLNLEAALNLAPRPTTRVMSVCTRVLATPLCDVHIVAGDLIRNPNDLHQVNAMTVESTVVQTIHGLLFDVPLRSILVDVHKDFDPVRETWRRAYDWLLNSVYGVYEDDRELRNVYRNPFAERLFYVENRSHPRPVFVPSEQEHRPSSTLVLPGEEV